MFRESTTTANGHSAAGGKAPCKFYAMKGGCNMGKSCWSYHDFGKASQRTQYPLTKEYTINHSNKAPIDEGKGYWDLC